MTLSSPAARPRKLVTALAIACTGFTLTAESALAVTGVEITGTNTDFGNQTFLSGTGGVWKEQLCGAPGSTDAVAAATDTLKQRMAPRMGAAGSKLQVLSQADVLKSVASPCKDPEDSSTAPFKIIYSACRMTMDSPDQLMDIVLPPGGEAGRMDMVDFQNREVYHVSLKREVNAADAAFAAAWGSDIDIDSGAAGDSIAGHATRKFNFSYTGGLGGGEGSPMGGMASMKNTGTVWVADKMDGIETVRSFYSNMTREIDPAQAQQGFIAGMVNNLVKMLQNGVPLRMQQTMESSMMGMVASTHRSHMEVHRSQVIELPSDWCGRNFIPEGFTVRDIDQEMSEAMGGGATDGAAAEAGASMQDLQNMMNEAMKDMTPEQREMMQQMMGGKAAQPAPNDNDE